MRSGSILLVGTNYNGSGAGFRHAGIYGQDWSLRGTSTTMDGTMAPSSYYLFFGITEVESSWGPYERWNAFPLRCLSTVLDI